MTRWCPEPPQPFICSSFLSIFFTCCIALISTRRSLFACWLKFCPLVVLQAANGPRRRWNEVKGEDYSLKHGSLSCMMPHCLLRARSLSQHSTLIDCAQATRRNAHVTGVGSLRGAVPRICQHTMACRNGRDSFRQQSRCECNIWYLWCECCGE